MAHQSKRQRAPVRRPWSDEDLEAYAVRYVARFDCTEQRLRAVLSRKSAASVDGGSGRSSEAAANAIDRLIVRFKQLGYVNDRRFAERLVESLRSRGASARQIRERLRTRGVDAEVTTELIADTRLSSEDDLGAALTWVKRRRMGPYRPAEQQRLRYQRDLAALARAGFSFDVARRALKINIGDDE